MIINRFFYAPPAPVYTVSTLAPSLVAKAGSDAAASNYLSTVAAYNNGSFNGGGADNTAFNSAYTTYVSTLPGGGFGRSSSTDTGYLIWRPVTTFYSNNTNSVILTSNVFPLTGYYKSGYSDSVDIINNSAVFAPIAGIYTRVPVISSSGFIISCTINGNFLPNGTYSSHGFISYGGTSGINVNANYGSSNSDFSIDFYYKIVPSDISVVSTDYPTSSRVNTVINNYAIKNENNTYNYITNKPIFDENNLVFYNPLTGVSFNVTGWYYDYSTRRYTLTYTDNSVSKTATVEYGYNYITVTADGAPSNYYYIA